MYNKSTIKVTKLTLTNYINNAVICGGKTNNNPFKAKIDKMLILLLSALHVSPHTC